MQAERRKGRVAAADTDHEELTRGLGAGEAAISEARAATIEARKYKFRKRMLTVMVLATVGCAVAALPARARGAGVGALGEQPAGALGVVHAG